MIEPQHDEYTDEGVEDLLDEEAPVAVLPTDDVDWGQRYMRAHRGITAAIARNGAAAVKETNRIHAWLDQRNGPLEARLARLEEALRAIAEHEMDASKGKRKKLSTPFGSVQLRKPSPRLVVDDECDALEFLSLRDDYEEYKVETIKLDKSAVKKLIFDTGEVIDGCHIETDEQHGMTIKHTWNTEADEVEK